MATGITISISLGQIGIFFAIMGAGVITVASCLVEGYAGHTELPFTLFPLLPVTGGPSGKQVIGCASVILAAGVVQLLSSIAFCFKDKMKKNWIYISTALIITYTVCLTVLVVAGVNADTFYLVVSSNWMLLLITIGLLSNDASSVVAILFGMLGTGVVVFSGAVLNAYGHNSGKVQGSTAAALVGGLIQTLSSIGLFFKAEKKEMWTNCNGLVCILLIVGFSVLFADGQRDSAIINRFYVITATDFVILFLVLGVFFKKRCMK